MRAFAAHSGGARLVCFRATLAQTMGALDYTLLQPAGGRKTMKRIGKILLGVTVVAGLIGGGVWYSKQRAAQNPEQRYKLADPGKG
jgi:hypothetical protein